MVPPRLLPMHSCDQLTETSGSGASESEGTCPYPIPIRCGDHLGQDLQLAILNSSSVLTNLRGVYCLDVALLTLPPEVHSDWNSGVLPGHPNPTAATLVVRRQKSLLGVCRFTHSCERKPRPSQLAANTKKLPRPQRPRRPTARLPAGLAGRPCPQTEQNAATSRGSREVLREGSVRDPPGCPRFSQGNMTQTLSDAERKSFGNKSRRPPSRRSSPAPRPPSATPPFCLLQST